MSNRRKESVIKSYRITTIMIKGLGPRKEDGTISLPTELGNE